MAILDWEWGQIRPLEKGRNALATPPTVLSILLKFYRCFDHGLKMCMWLGYNPQIIFCHFFFTN